MLDRQPLDTEAVGADGPPGLGLPPMVDDWYPEVLFRRRDGRRVGALAGKEQRAEMAGMTPRIAPSTVFVNRGGEPNAFAPAATAGQRQIRKRGRLCSTPPKRGGYKTVRRRERVKSGMPGRFTNLEVRDPRLITPAAWDSLPLQEKAVLDKRGFISSREWTPLDQRRFRIEPESYRTQYSTANIGRLRAHRIADSLAMQFTIQLPTVDVVRIVVFERGGGRFVLPGGHEPAIVHASVGAVYSDEPGFLATTSDENSRLMLTLPAGLLHQKLEALLDGKQAGSVAFEPVFDVTRGAGATIRRMFNFLFTELEHPDSLLTNKVAIQSYEEHLALCLLVGLPHSYSERLLRQQTAAAPANIKRAEEFMHANAREPLTIEAIADAAGCSIRALQLTFRRFRGTTPMAALQRLRLEAARTEILRADRAQSLARIAAEHGFSNPSRFAQLFRRTYGAYPSEALRTRRDVLVEQR
jgi:AraC-like DNA-binding protein